MSEPSDSKAKSELSALVDGELSSFEAARICAAFKDDEDSRRAWHTYQLIGDTLRSDDLATDPARDCDFMARLRVRLDAEPVVLAPLVAQALHASEFPEVRARVASGVATRTSSARRWKMPMTVAASVLAVSGVLMVARVSGLMGPDAVPQGLVAQQGVAGNGLQGFVPTRVGNGAALQNVSAQGNASGNGDPGASLSAMQPQTLAASGKLIRDARLDQYLAAHKQFGGSTALGVPSGFLRSATSEGRDR